jgi:hypothetical protein
MRRQIQGLSRVGQADDEIADGVYLVRVAHFRYHPKRQKPFFVVELSIMEPRPVSGRLLSGRLYATPKAVWKLSWFLRDFGYAPDLMDRDEVDEKAVVGLQGVVKVTHVVASGRRWLNLDAFAPVTAWENHPADQSGVGWEAAS